MLALLGALNGSMTESSDLRKWDQFVQFLARPHYNALDLGLLVQTQLANVTASETGVPDVVHQRVESFNEMAEEASVLFDPATVVQNILEGKVDPLFVLSPAMAKGEKAEMTPADWTQLEALRILAERIQNEASDPVVQKWKAGQGRSISLVVVDPNEGTYDLATVLTNISQLVIGNTPFNTLGIKSNNFLVVHGNVVGEVRQVRAKDVISKLKLSKVSFHGLDIPGVEWNFEGTEVSIVSLILALSGGLMTQVLPGVVEKLKAEKAIRTAA